MSDQTPGTCATCRYAASHKIENYGGLGWRCINERSAADELVPDAMRSWGCRLHEPLDVSLRDALARAIDALKGTRYEFASDHIAAQEAIRIGQCALDAHPDRQPPARAQEPR